jgi:hypothetical protein
MCCGPRRRWAQPECAVSCSMKNICSEVNLFRKLTKQISIEYIRRIKQVPPVGKTPPRCCFRVQTSAINSAILFFCYTEKNKSKKRIGVIFHQRTAMHQAPKLILALTICLLGSYVRSDSCMSCTANYDCHIGFYCCDGQCTLWPAIGEACPCSQ